MRQIYIAGNWKMNKTVGEARELARRVVEAVSSTSHRIMIAPPFTALAAVAEVVSGTGVRLGAQNMAPEESGAHTGEVSVLMLKDVGVETVILGHSERRTLYGEDDALVRTKVGLALEHGLEVILCVGETLEERQANRAEEVVGRQIDAGLKGLSESKLDGLVVAYEPVWAIGTGKTATPEDAEAMHRYIRRRVSGLYSSERSEELTIQYGGSVKPANATSLLSRKEIDGALVGGASLEADSFKAIVGAA